MSDNTSRRQPRLQAPRKGSYSSSHPCGILLLFLHSGHSSAGGTKTNHSRLFVTQRCAFLAFFLLAGAVFVRNWSLSPFSHSRRSNDDVKPPACVARLIGPDSSWQDWIQRQAQLPSHLRCAPTSKSCRCVDPSQASKRGAKWDKAFERNKAIVRNHSQPSNLPLDMVMLGDSFLEFWMGSYLNTPQVKMRENRIIFDRLFQSTNSSLHAIALGISSDQTSHLLYRLLNGEMPSELEAGFFFVLIGTNNIGTGCSANVTIAGITKVVGLIRQRNPTSTILLHALFPRGKESFEGNPLWQQIALVNTYLECYAEGDPRVIFVNHTDIALLTDHSRVNQTLFPDYLHPTAAAYELWGQRILQSAL